MPVSLDEYPIHQGSESKKRFLTGDRNVYDRCIMHALDRTGEQWIQRVDHDLDAEATRQRVAWTMIDHAARATFDERTAQQEGSREQRACRSQSRGASSKSQR